MTRTRRAAPTRSGGRLIAVDWARSAAIVAMAVYHFGWDMQMVGLLPPGTTAAGWWPVAARTIAASFLFLAGLSMWLAHGRRLRPGAWLRRFAQLVAAAAAVSAATWIAVPEAWVRFGILHSIALSSAIGLAFLRLPWWLTAGAAAAVLWGGPLLRDPAFDGAWWLWSGLGTRGPAMIDWEPLVPWLAPFLAGLAVGQVGGARLLRWGPSRPGAVAGALAWPGRHALAIYLIHQPVLIGALHAYVWIVARL